MGKLVPYRDSLIKDLQDPKEASAYLNMAVEEDDPELFLRVLRDVIDAYGTVTKASRETGIKRVSLHKMLAPGGNPRAENLIALFNYLGIKFDLDWKKGAKKAA